MNQALDDLRREVAAFRAWATPEETRYAIWETSYPEWDALSKAFCAMLADDAPERWSGETIALMLYVLARNEEILFLKRRLFEKPRHTIVLARAGLSAPDAEARWQLAEALGEAGEREEAFALLLRYFEDTDPEYISRLALFALQKRRYPQLEPLALRAWERGDEWQRVGALWVLANLESPHLPRLLDAADADGREWLVKHAQRIRAGERQD
jgi:hypothetical protein